MSSLTLTHDLAEPWTERRHAAEAYVREVLGSQYPLVPREDDPLRQRVELALTRRSEGPFALDPQAAADLLEAHFLSGFEGVDEWSVEWRICNGCAA